MTKLKRNSILIILSFLLGFLSAALTQRFRFVPDWRWLYLMGVILSYTFHFIALLSSLIFLILLLKKDVNLKVKYKWGWISLSLIPVSLWIFMFIIIIFESSTSL